MPSAADVQLTWRQSATVFALVFLFAWSLTTHGKFSVAGDEPHYLMIAESLRSDRDLDLTNNYAQDHGRLFGHEQLPVELHAARARNGELRSIHGPGLAVFVLPVYWLAQAMAPLVPEERLRAFRMSRGLFVYSIVSLSLIAWTALGTTLVAMGLANIAGRRMAMTLAVAIGISPPVVSHAFLIFPEVFAVFVSSLVVWFVTKVPRGSDRKWLFLVLTCVGVLPWFHQKYLLYTIGLLVMMVLRRRDVIPALPLPLRLLGIVICIGPQVGFLMWQYHEWGSFGGAFTTGVLTDDRLPLTLSTLNQGAIGLLFDDQSGLAAFMPMLWIVPICWWLTIKRSWDVSVPIALLYLPAASFVIGWWAGFSPAARYLAPAIPLLAIPVALALRHRAVRLAAGFLLACQVAVNLVVWQHPRWLWPSTEDNRVLDALSWPGRTYAALLPSVKTEGLTERAIAPIAVLVAVSAAVAIAVRIDERRQLKTASRSRGQRSGM